MKIYLCNEVIREFGIAEQCRFARETGFDGLELAPFTLADDPSMLTASALSEIRRIADGEGIEIAGLHWLMAAPEGLSITSLNDPAWQSTVDFGCRLVEICRETGGRYLVHGSPAQRMLAAQDRELSRDRGIAYFDAVGAEATAHQINYIIEPLSSNDTNFINEVAEARAIIRQLGCPGLKTMIDCYAAVCNGHEPARLIRDEMPEGDIAHIHINDSNRRGPGQGDTDFRAVMDALRDTGYAGGVGVEPFDYFPDGPACAARAIGYLRGILR